MQKVRQWGIRLNCASAVVVVGSGRPAPWSSGLATEEQHISKHIDWYSQLMCRNRTDDVGGVRVPYRTDDVGEELESASSSSGYVSH